jgi:hypothetical protein
LRRQIKCSVADLVLWHGSRLSHDVTSDRNHLTPNLSQMVARTGIEGTQTAASAGVFELR